MTPTESGAPELPAATGTVPEPARQRPGTAAAPAPTAPPASDAAPPPAAPPEAAPTRAPAPAPTPADAPAPPTHLDSTHPDSTHPDATRPDGTRPDAPHWEPGRRFVLRAAGLPVESVHGLRCPGTRRWADVVLAEEERLRAAGADLSDLLHTLVKATTGPEEAPGDAAVRRGLINLRRQVFNNRLPADPEAAVRLVTDRDAEAGRRTAAWLRDRARLAELRSDGEQLLAGELRDSRRALREALADERLRAGLLLASPALDGRLDAYLNDTAERPGSRLRKIERSALTYLYRTACKTSPFSTLTGVGLGSFAGPAGDDGAALRCGDTWVSHVRLNVVVLTRLTELITADPERRRDLPLVVSPGWGRDADRIRYVRHVTTAGDDRAAVTFDAVRDRLFFLRSSGTLDGILDWLGGRAEPVRHRDLVDRLEREHGAGREECERYASALLELGMVQVAVLRTDVHSRDPLDSYRAALRSLAVPWADRLDGLLDGPARCLARYPGADVAERRSLLAALRAGLLEAQRDLGADDPVLPQTLVYEDVDTGGELVCGPDVLGGDTGRALRAVEGVLPLFDLTLPHRITLLGFFLARYGRGGRCDDVLGLVHDFHEDFFDQYVSFTGRRVPFDASGAYVPEENWLGQEEMRTLDRARRLFHDGMRALWKHGETAEELELPGALLTGTAAELKPLAGHFTPQSHHLQLGRPPGEPGRDLVVLNKSYGGLAFPFSRFTHLWDPTGTEDEPTDAADTANTVTTADAANPANVPEAAHPAHAADTAHPAHAADTAHAADASHAAAGLSDALRQELAARAPEGAVFAEVTGGPVSSNLNLHGRLTGHHIVCPGETSSVPEDARIDLDDLYVEHDERAGRLVLRSRRLGREVVPVYLGYLVPIALPEIPRTLLLLSPSTMAPVDVWAGVPEGEPVDGVNRRPRVRHGNVVVSRRSWTADAGVLPVRDPAAGEEEHYLAWVRWQRAHELPDRCFATVQAPDRGPVGAKPLYVDFDSPLSLSAFEALVEREPGVRVTFREMLPAEDALHLTSARGRHVAELAVETFTTRPLPSSPTEVSPSCPN
ncbi:lantibiotic dehydratase [Streptomyces sp. bgisy022]|uniref:lantibiotic dehydratase n=1 Tax=Streptomyces sp. bgisy022 TaxID=3413769 RepID=UPI003D73D5B7